MLHRYGKNREIQTRTVSNNLLQFNSVFNLDSLLLDYRLC